MYDLSPTDTQSLFDKYYASLEAESSLYAFFKQAWPMMEGSIPYIDGWHIQAISEHLEAAFKRDIRNLMIHVPPRSSKTSLISVAFPAWCWIHNPGEKFMYASYAYSLAVEHSLKCRRLIESPWYQQRWQDRFQLSDDQNAKSFFENDQFGYRLSTSVGSSATGKGASILVVDDGNNARDQDSEVKRESTNQWWGQVWTTRLNDPKKDVRIVVQQRIHETDLSGHILSNDIDKEWTTLILPMELEEGRRSKTFINGKTWQDPRKTEGELLCEKRFGSDEIKRFKQELGSYGYAGQYQQRPSPESGGIIKKSWFRMWDKEKMPPMQYVIQSWDTALEANESNCYSACTTWGVFSDVEDGYPIHNLILLSMWRGKVEYPDLRKMAQRLYKDYRDTGIMTIDPNSKYVPDIVLVEAKVSGISLIQDLRRAGINALKFDPSKYGDKIKRVRLTTPYIEGGRVFVPSKKPDFKIPFPFAEEFIESCCSFPNANDRDLVDTMTQVLLRLSKAGDIVHPTDEKYIPRKPSLTREDIM